MFDFAGSMSNSAPVTRVWQIGETCYQGQLLMSSHADTDCYGASWVMDAAGEANEDNHPCIGMVSGVHTINDAGYSGTTGYGDTATRRDTKATQVANDPVGQTLVEMTVIQPGETLINGPLYNGAYGTAITELVVSGADSAGTTVTHTGITAIDYADDYGVVYCRSGENRGHYRTMVTPGAAAQITHVCFPYGIAVNDVFVSAGGVPGITAMQIGSTANYINAADTLSSHYDIWLHTQNLEEQGKEYYIFAFLPSACGFKGHLG